jgi:hypothetical protein
MSEREALDPYEAVRYNLPNAKFKEAVDVAFCALVKQIVPDTNVGNKWISVSDHLPNDTEKVLVYTTTGNTTVARWSQRQGKFVASGHITVTHWMSLPEKPEGEV